MSCSNFTRSESPDEADELHSVVACLESSLVDVVEKARPDLSLGECAKVLVSSLGSIARTLSWTPMFGGRGWSAVAGLEELERLLDLKIRQHSSDVWDPGNGLKIPISQDQPPTKTGTNVGLGVAKCPPACQPSKVDRATQTEDVATHSVAVGDSFVGSSEAGVQDHASFGTGEIPTIPKRKKKGRRKRRDLRMSESTSSDSHLVSRKGPVAEA